MNEPIKISEDYLFAKIGRLVVEVELLRAQLAAEQAKQAELEQPEPEGGNE